MKRIDLKKTPRQELYRKPPKEQDSENLVSEACELYFEDRKILTYLTELELEPLRSAILNVTNIYSNRRQSGVASQSRTFGFNPRMPLQQRDYCYPCSLNRDYPEVCEAFFDYAGHFSKLMREHYSDRYDHSVKSVAEVNQDFKIPGSVFTSGILNYDNPLQYHYDAGNIEGTWSMMAVFKNKTMGGNLILPEYDVKLSCSDRSIVIFDGQSELHGVSPIVKTEKESYRYSIVFYALAGMLKCGTRAQELKRAQITRTKTEMKRAGVLK